MEVDTGVTADAIRDAASVVLLRDAADGIEVFLVERHGRSDVLGGAHVFPGGKLDAEDSDPAVLARLDTSATALHASLAEPALAAPAGAALYVAAARELFEETGVLLARHIEPAHVASAWARARSGEPFPDILADLDAQLATGALQPWSRWITPRIGAVSRKRFDTRFFLARVPPGQQPHHDDHEATSSVWLTPRAALERYWDRRIQLAPPQVIGLAHLARHTSVDGVFAEARSRSPVLVEPHPVEIDGERVMCYPGDPAYPGGGVALPGPSRLHVRGGRFEPAEGFEGFFRS